MTNLLRRLWIGYLFSKNVSVTQMGLSLEKKRCAFAINRFDIKRSQRDKIIIGNSQYVCVLAQLGDGWEQRFT